MSKLRNYGKNKSTIIIISLGSTCIFALINRLMYAKITDK